jgi:hypothetical protein
MTNKEIHYSIWDSLYKTGGKEEIWDEKLYGPDEVGNECSACNEAIKVCREVLSKYQNPIINSFWYFDEEVDNSIVICQFCPIEWNINKEHKKMTFIYCQRRYSPFEKWRLEEDNEKKKILAKQIRDLWR